MKKTTKKVKSNKPKLVMIKNLTKEELESGKNVLLPNAEVEVLPEVAKEFSDKFGDKVEL